MQGLLGTVNRNFLLGLGFETRSSTAVYEAPQKKELVGIQVKKFDATLAQVPDRNMFIAFIRPFPDITARNGLNKTIVGDEVYLEPVKIDLSFFGVMIGDFGAAK